MFNIYPKERVFGFEKSKSEELQFALSDRKGKMFVDIRVYYLDGDGSKIPTHKGVFVEIEKLPLLKEGIERLIEAGTGKKRTQEKKV
ncbi:MAG: hypothetical protein HZC17_00170 [Candidatus Omnitrophica bacterium]|nr:hypothetical protein [Candidatus Omnitrophota bacterium]